VKNLPLKTSVCAYGTVSHVTVNVEGQGAVSIFSTIIYFDESDRFARVQGAYEKIKPGDCIIVKGTTRETFFERAEFVEASELFSCPH
jgi:hypothetical protein